MENQQLKLNVEINGVVLTQKAIDRLKSLQNGNNELLKDSDRVIANAICLILQNFGGLRNDEKIEVANLLEEMAIVRYNMKDLACPENECVRIRDPHP